MIPDVTALTRAATWLEETATAATPGVRTAIELPPNEHRKHPGHWVQAVHDDGDTISTQVVADCPWRQADAQLAAAFGPDQARLLATVFRHWARIGSLDPDLLHRVGGAETVALARGILGHPRP